MTHALVIINPVSGRGRGTKAEPEIRRLLEAEGLDFDLARTTAPWHAASPPGRCLDYRSRSKT